MEYIYPKNFEEKVGFDRIRALVSSRCLFSLGVKKVGEISFYTDFETILRLIAETDEMKTICLMDDSFPVDNYIDSTPFLERIQVVGTWLDERELFDLRKSLDSIKSLLSFFRRGDVPRYPNLTNLTKGLSYYPYVTDRIDSILNKFGKIKDNASPELARIRSEVSAKQASVSKRIQSILKQGQSEGFVESDATPAVRDGRIVIPVAAANKRKIKGFVHDESASGKTVYIEPVEVVELNNEIRELEYAERREVIRILVEFTDTIRPYLPELILAYDFLGTIDFIRAKALFAIDVGGAKPILTSKPHIFIRQAKHPLLFLTLKREGKEIVPLDVELNVNERILLISGPNAGGKSVCLKTVGLLQYMLQCGFLPSLLENSEIGVFDKIFIDIGDEQSIENDLSTYSSHLLNMKHFLRNADSKSLILIDEFGAGTEPMVGGAIAESILQRFCEQGTFGIITTHYTNLKHFASGTHGIVNGAMLFDVSKIQPLFRLEVGKPGSSFAFEIARKIGLPEDVLQSASSKVGEDHVSFEKHLREISRDKRYWEKKRDNIRLTNRKVEEMEKKLEQELLSIKEQRKEILTKAKKEAGALLLDTNRQIENTIRVIKETNAQKEKTKEVRIELEDFKEDFESKINSNDEDIEKKILQIKEKQKRREEKNKEKGQIDNEISEELAPKSMEKGDKVKIKEQDIVGEIVEVGQKNAVVAFGNMMTSIDIDKLELISANEYRKANREVSQPRTGASVDTHKRRLNFKSNIDTRGFRADEAIRAVQELVDEALMLGIGQVRILHGKGNGILRQLIREYLATHPGVKSFADEHIEFGGTGITNVTLDL
ncbi:MAG: Smr/MutS family protein [Bacteroidales bacterium]|nr:Smr/MutS family protein [Bacteroidales bacterium]